MTTETAPQLPEAVKQPPFTKIRVGLITANIWRRQGKTKPFYAVTFERSYKNAAGEWKTTHSYDGAGLAELRIAADLAHEKVLELINSGA